MSLKKLKFGDKEINKKEFYSSKQAIPIPIHQIVVIIIIIIIIIIMIIIIIIIITKIIIIIIIFL